MRLKGKRIGLAVTGSHCTLENILPQMENIKKEGAEIQVILSESVLYTDTKFGKAKEWHQKFSQISGKPIITNIVQAEPIGPQKMFDCVVIAPCTGNTIGKLANGITDGAVLMAVKAHLRNTRPVVIALSTNDGLGNNAKNIGELLNKKNIYFVPFSQDDPINKPNSIVANLNLLVETVLAALEGKQLQPLLDK